MRVFTAQEIERAREMDLLTYLTQNEPEQLVHVSGRTYSVRDHSSLKISNGKWMWWAHGFGGHTALDFLIKVREIPFPKAVAMILKTDCSPPSLSSKPRKESSKRLLLPDECESNERVIRYLIGRGIHPKLVDTCIERGILYESKPYHNCVFLGFDEQGVARYAFYRSTNNERIMGEAAGSDKRYTFRVTFENSALHVFESAIDLLSFATIKKIWTGKWPKESMLSLGGVYVPIDDPERARLPKALDYFLETRPDIEKIYLHLDNDAAGRKTSKMLRCLLQGSFEIQDQPPRDGKDMNDELCFLLSQIKHEQERNDVNGS